MTAPLATAWTIARRDLQARFTGLRLLIACLFLGVATLAAIGSLTTAITQELAARGQNILGGDLEVGLAQREATAGEIATLRALGPLSQTIRMQAMARLPDGSDSQLVELKGVDRAYPLYGTMQLDGQPDNRDPQPGEIYVTPALIDRLNLKLGDRLDFGETRFTVAAIIADEPDRLSEGLSFGPVVITSLDGLRATQLIRPGSLFEAKYRLRLPADSDPEAIKDDLALRFANAAWEIETRGNAAPAIQRFIARMGQFLTLVGLSALVIAGIGVGNGVASYLRGKQGAIATLKTLGADSAMIFRIYLLQIFAVSTGAIIAGLIAGMVVPFVIIALAGDVLPVSPEFAVHPLPLIVSAIYGLLIALIFALPPLAQARRIPAAGIFRGRSGGWRDIDRSTLLGVAAAVSAIIALAILTSYEPIFSAGFIAVAIGILLLLAGLGVAIRWLASRLPRPRTPLLRLALTNLHRPGAQTGQLVVALGLGLTLFAILAAIQTSLNNEIRQTVPRDAPDYFILDIPVEEADDFRTLVRRVVPDAEINMVPTMRGVITQYGEQRVAELAELPDGAWMLRGDRGLTYSAALPAGSTLVAGDWWAQDYAGPPLVSIEEEAAQILGLSVGDRFAVSLLGVEVSATIASIRRVDWQNFGFNYIIVFNPAALAQVPHTLAATVQGDNAKAAALPRALPERFPSASIVKVKEVAGQITTILDQMATAIAAAASIAVFAGIAVLIGAIAASRQARTYDSVILKLLGARRSQILGAQAIEYGVLALLLTGVALLLGLGAAWYVITQIFEFGWRPDWGVVLGTMGIGALVTLGIGLIGSIPVLSARPARALREL